MNFEKKINRLIEEEMLDIGVQYNQGDINRARFLLRSVGEKFDFERACKINSVQIEDFTEDNKIRVWEEFYLNWTKGVIRRMLKKLVKNEFRKNL